MNKNNLYPHTFKAIFSLTLLTNAIALSTASQASDTSILEKRVSDLEQRLEVTLDALDNVTQSSDMHSSSNTRIGGYGELHYNNLSNNKVGGTDKKEIDFHRFVLFFAKDFTDDIRFFSELEIEHALAGDGDDKPGEVELEQAFVEFDLTDHLSAKGGLFLVPVGIINETHEPTTFYGVERNPIEKNIIPATWWEGGAALTGQIATGWQYDIAITSGLNNTSYNIRKGRQKVAEASAEDLAYTGRVKWTGIAGLEVAATVQRQDNITQGTDPDASATLLESHVVWNQGMFGLRALYSTWQVDGNGAKAIGADEQTGWYIEPSLRISPKVGVFARLNQWDNAAGDNTDSEYQQVDIGVNYWPHENVVVKLDYQTQDVPNGKDEFDGINLGIGYNL